MKTQSKLKTFLLVEEDDTRGELLTEVIAEIFGKEHAIIAVKTLVAAERAIQDRAKPIKRGRMEFSNTVSAVLRGRASDDGFDSFQSVASTLGVSECIPFHAQDERAIRQILMALRLRLEGMTSLEDRQVSVGGESGKLISMPNESISREGLIEMGLIPRLASLLMEVLANYISFSQPQFDPSQPTTSDLHALYRAIVSKAWDGRRRIDENVLVAGNKRLNINGVGLMTLYRIEQYLLRVNWVTETPVSDFRTIQSLPEGHQD